MMKKWKTVELIFDTKTYIETGQTYVAAKQKFQSPH